MLSLESDYGRKGYKQYYLPTLEIKYYNNMIDRRSVFDKSLLKTSWKTYDNIRKITTGQGDNYTTICLLDYNYLKIL